MPGTLYIVATPIGNLNDITARALQTLKEVDFILAEDTRRTLPMLTHFGIQKKIVSYFEYSKDNKTEWILSELEKGLSLALVSDAGTPTISDPGARLVAKAYARNIEVISIPGPVAFVTAVSMSGFPTEPLHFWGFLPPSNSKRRKIYDLISNLDGIHCFYEPPYKLLKHFEEWCKSFPDYFIFVAKEITKKFESKWRGRVSEVFETVKTENIRGEYVICLTKELL